MLVASLSFMIQFVFIIHWETSLQWTVCLELVRKNLFSPTVYFYGSCPHVLQMFLASKEPPLSIFCDTPVKKMLICAFSATENDIL